MIDLLACRPSRVRHSEPSVFQVRSPRCARSYMGSGWRSPRMTDACAPISRETDRTQYRTLRWKGAESLGDADTEDVPVAGSHVQQVRRDRRWRSRGRGRTCRFRWTGTRVRLPLQGRTSRWSRIRRRAVGTCAVPVGHGDPSFQRAGHAGTRIAVRSSCSRSSLLERGTGAGDRDDGRDRRHVVLESPVAGGLVSGRDQDGKRVTVPRE